MTFEEMREKVLSLDIILQMQAYNDFYADPYGDYTEKRLYPWFDEEGRYNTIEQVARLYKMEESEIFMLGVNMQIRYGDERAINCNWEKCVFVASFRPCILCAWANHLPACSACPVANAYRNGDSWFYPSAEFQHVYAGKRGVELTADDLESISNGWDCEVLAHKVKRKP